MTIISAGVVTKQGRILLSRQFSDINRVRIEGLLSAFPRLVASLSEQVTYIDAGTVRYIYQPLEEFFLVLVTTTKSNIVEDLATLQMMGRLIPEYVPEGITEQSLDAHSFDVFFALDEVVVGGKREAVAVEQIRTYLEMESFEEQQALETKRIQMENAKKITAEHARQLRERRMAGQDSGNSGGAYGGISSEDPNYGGFGGSMNGGANTSSYQGGNATLSSTQITPPPTTAATAQRSGMSLGKARKADIGSTIQKEMGITVPPPSIAPATSSSALKPTAGESAGNKSSAIAQEGVHINIEERMSAVLHRDGETAPVDMKGELSILITDPQSDRVKLRLAPVNEAFSFRAHAKVNKALFAGDHVLAMADGKPFPLQQAVTILRWRLSSQTMTAPIVFTCWPEPGSITIEYELVDSAAPPLRHVRLAIPLYGAVPQEVQPSTGTCQVADGSIIWTIEEVSGSQCSSGNIEISVDVDGANAGGELFFPVQVSMTSPVSLGHVRVLEAVSTETGQAVRFSHDTRLLTENMVIQ